MYGYMLIGIIGRQEKSLDACGMRSDAVLLLHVVVWHAMRWCVVSGGDGVASVRFGGGWIGVCVILAAQGWCVLSGV